MYKQFEDEIRSQDYSTSSIESPNDGQAALLIASGLLANDVIEVQIEGQLKRLLQRVLYINIKELLKNLTQMVLLLVFQKLMLIKQNCMHCL